jgi:aspartyl-tRNA(Asn)/glutamyl-tRNA(Gln) amidotransferase subunit A
MDYRYAGIGELRAALRGGSATPAELATEALSLLGEVGSRFGAVATLLPERARAEAAASIARSRDGDEPLAGVPYAVKDLFAARGGPTTWGSAEFRDRIIDRDATVVERLASAGGVLVAKLAMSEFAGGGRPKAPGASIHAPNRNPWDPERYSGGSSSGSGIAVALGLVPYALGTETGGSILGPAAFSGVTGLRPTVGLVPRRGVMTLSWTLDKVGPMARSAADCATVLEAMTSGRFRRIAAGDLGSALRGVRLAISETELDECAPEVRDAVARGLEELRGVAATLVPLRYPRTPSSIAALERIIEVEGAFGVRELLRRPGFTMSDAKQQGSLTRALDVPVADYLEACRTEIPRAQRAFSDAFSGADVIVAASRTGVAPRLDEARAPRDASRLADLLRAGGNLAGVPGISIPCGLSSDGLPVALQLVGRRGSDALLLGLAEAFQRATGHHLARPPEIQPA